MHCQKIFAIALATLLASSTTVGPAMAQGRVGPSFECGANVANQPLAQIMCASDELARLDLSYVIAYQALRESTDGQGRKVLAVEANAFSLSVTEQCNIPKSGVLGRTAAPGEIACIKERLQLQRRMLMNRLSGELLEEAKLLPEETLAIQRALQGKGHLSDTATVDGVIGPATRSAISAWQRSVGQRETGVASRAIISAEPTAVRTPAPNQPLELHRGVVPMPPPERDANGNTPVQLAQQPQQTLRQQRAESLERFDTTGYCVGFFDIDGKAGETLELSGTIPQQKAQEFLRRIAREGATARGVIPQLALLYGFLSQNEEFAREVMERFQSSVQRGKADSASATKTMVLEWYEKCEKLSPAAPAAPPSAGSNAPPISPRSSPPAAPRTVSASQVAYLDPPNPIYPVRARRAGQKGTVTLRVLIDTTGRPAEVSVQGSSGHAELDQAALEAVRAARFRPYLEGGIPQAVWVQVPINFVSGE